jgi:regulatory protein
LPEPVNPIRRAALNLLARREHSAAELVLKLRKLGFPETDIQPVLNTLTEEGLLNQSRFIEIYVYSRQRRGYGPLRIQSELISRGISEDMIEHHLKIADNAWFAHAQKVWQKRFKGLIPRDFKTRAQQMRFLQYRGFTSEQIEQLFKTSEISS